MDDDVYISGVIYMYEKKITLMSANLEDDVECSPACFEHHLKEGVNLFTATTLRPNYPRKLLFQTPLLPFCR